MRLLRERYAGLKKAPLLYCCNQVWMKNGGRIPWSATASCETCKIYLLSGGKTPHEWRFGETFKGTIIPLRLDGRISPFFCLKSCRDCISSARKSYQELFSVMYYTRGEIWKGEIMVADVEELDKMDASEIHAGRLNAKEVLTPKNGEHVDIPDRRWNSQNIWKSQVLRTSTLIRDPPRPRRREPEHLLGGSDGFSPQFQDSSPDDGEARNDFWSISGNYICCHHVEPERRRLYVPRGESFPIPLRYIDVTRATSTDLDVMLERRIDDYWNYRRKPRPIRFVDRVHTIRHTGRKTSGWVFMVPGSS